MHDYLRNPDPQRRAVVTAGVAAYVSVRLLDATHVVNILPLKDPVLLVALSELLGFGMVYQILSVAVDRWLWRYSPWRVPDLSGEWICEGVSSFEGMKWNGHVRIIQRLSAISITLESGESRSRSSMAKLVRDDGGDVRLEVVFQNIGQGNTKSLTGVTQSIGFAEYVFDLKRGTGCGEYAISAPRHNTGTINLRRA